MADLRHALRGALAGMLVGVLASGSVFAQGPVRAVSGLSLQASRPKLAVLVVGLDQASSAQAAQLSFLAEQAAARADRFDLAPLTEALDRDAAAGRKARLAEAEEVMQKAQKAYDDLDAVKALELFDRAVKLYEQTDLTRNFNRLIQAWSMKAASMIANGETKAGEAELDRIIPLEPRLTLSVNYFPAEQIAYAEKVRKTVSGNATHALEVKTSPVNAQVYVDGRFQGMAPLTVSGLTPADHYVTLIAPGFSLHQTRARSGAIDQELRKAEGHGRHQAAAEKVRQQPEGPARDKAAQELGAQLGVEQVLLTVARKSTAGDMLEVTALRVDVADGHNHAYRVGELPLGEPLPQSADAFYTALLSKDDPRDGGPLKHFAGAGGGGNKTLGYALLGVGGALLAGGVFFGLQAGAQSNEFRTYAQTDPRAAEASSAGRTYAVLADVFVIAGLVSAGTGGYFAFKGGGESAPAKRSAPRPDPRPRTEEPPQERREEPKPPPVAEEPPKAQQRPPPTKAQEDEAQQQANEEARRQDEELRRREAEKKKAEEARKRAAEEERKKKQLEEKRKQEEEDDLRNY